MFLTTLKQWYKRHERILIPIMLIAGVIVDFITFRTIEVRSAFMILIGYWVIAGATILFIHANRSGQGSLLARYYRVLAPLVIQFTFGATLSASFIFYWFSGSFSVSWPLMSLIAFLMIANEAFREYYMKPIIQLGVYYFITFSLFTLILPYVFNSISAWIFVLGGLLSLLFGYAYLRLGKKFVIRINHVEKHVRGIALGIFAIMNMLYFTNFIPPIPLSLTQAGVYHNIERVHDGYVFTGEHQTIFEKIMPGEIIHIQEGELVYVYSAIFAPFDLNTSIVHEWEYFNEGTKQWETRDRLGFYLYGGREQGYRGYSQKSSLEQGFWRVNVQTQRGQTIGVIRFKVMFVSDPIQMRIFEN